MTPNRRNSLQSMIINTETHNWARYRALHSTRKIVIKLLFLGLGNLLGGRGIGGG